MTPQIATSAFVMPHMDVDGLVTDLHHTEPVKTSADLLWTDFNRSSVSTSPHSVGPNWLFRRADFLQIAIDLAETAAHEEHRRNDRRT